MFTKGTKVCAHRDIRVHPNYRGRNGTVQGQGVCGTVEVMFDGDATSVYIDPAVLDVIAPVSELPPQEEEPQG